MIIFRLKRNFFLTKKIGKSTIKNTNIITLMIFNTFPNSFESFKIASKESLTISNLTIANCAKDNFSVLIFDKF